MEHILPENRSNYNNKLSKCFKTRDLSILALLTRCAIKCPAS